jgi:hypothetical protein
MSDLDLERHLDGGPEPAGTDAVAERRLAGLLAVALDAQAAALARQRVEAALGALAPSARRRSVATIRRRIQPRRWPWFAAAAAAVAVATILAWPTDPGRLGDGSRVATEAGAAWRSEATTTGPLIHLDAGRIIVNAAPQTPGSRLAVRTREAEVSVVGTGFSVAAMTTGTLVEVERGRVAVRGRRIADQELTAGGRLLIPAAGGWRSRIVDQAGLRSDPIAWWLGTIEDRDGSPALALVPGDEGTWVGVRARLRGTYVVAAGDRLVLGLHARRSVTVAIQAELDVPPGAPRFAVHQVPLVAGENRIAVPWSDLLATSGDKRRVAPGDRIQVLLLHADSADRGVAALRELTIDDPGP